MFSSSDEVHQKEKLFAKTAIRPTPAALNG